MVSAPSPCAQLSLPQGHPACLGITGYLLSSLEPGPQRERPQTTAFPEWQVELSDLIFLQSRELWVGGGGGRDSWELGVWGGCEGGSFVPLLAAEARTCDVLWDLQGVGG